MNKILTMPVIDLDHEVRVTSRRAPRWHLQILVTLTAGALLFGLNGEPGNPPRPNLHDMATFCPLARLLDGASSTEMRVVDPTAGNVVRIVHCPA